MTAPALAQGVGETGTAAPARFVRWLIIGIACAAALGSFQLAFASDELSERGLQAALLNWITLPYIVAGVIAWSRRPDSRFGPLMVGAGFTMFLSSLQWSSAGVPYTVGLAFDLLLAALLVHLFLAFPTGRLEGTPERVVVAAGYAAAIGLQLAKMLLGGAEARNVLALVPGSGVVHTMEDVQLIALSVVCLAGLVLLAGRRRGSVRPLPPRIALFVDSFALGLLATAVLLLAGAFEWPEFETIRRVTFGIIGVAPIAFLIGLLNARLSHSTLGDLLVRLRASPAPGDVRQALADALRDQSLTLAYWLPEFGRWVDGQGRPIELPEPDSGRASTLIDRDGERMAVLIHDASLADEPGLLDGVKAAAAIALENGRLQAELSARLEELRGSRRRVIEAGQLERQRLERNLHDGAQQRLIALSLELGLLEQRLADDPGDEDPARPGACGDRAVSRGAPRRRAWHPPGGGDRPRPGGRARVARRSSHRSRPADRRPGRAHPRAARGGGVLRRQREPRQHRQARRRRVGDRGRRPQHGQVVVEIVDDGVGGADTERGSGLRGLADRVEGLGGRLRIWTPRGGGTRVRAEMPCA